MNDGYRQDADEILAELRDALPHGRFSLRLDTYADTPVIAVVCRCGRTQPFRPCLVDDTLVRWLTNHDDEEFLTPQQRWARDEAVVKFSASASIIFMET